MALAAVLPPESAQQLRLGELLLREGDEVQALKAYQSALIGIERQRKEAPGNGGGDGREVLRAANLGAARASFALANFSLARHYIAELPESDPAAHELAAQLNRLDALDPFASKIAPRQRRERTVADFRIALDRLARCGVPFAVGLSKETPESSADPAQWSQFANWALRLAPLMNERKLRDRDDIIESAMRFAFQAESAAQPLCGKPSLDDEALLLLARQRMGAAQ
jgi:hypothetical protein